MADNKNLILPEISNHWTNLGTAHILKHNCVTAELFANRERNRLIHYGDKVALRYNQWQKELTKYKAPTPTDQMEHKDLGRGTSVEQFIPLTSYGCVSELIPMSIIKRAMATEEDAIEFITDKIEQASSRGMWEIDKKFLADITNDNNYNKNSIIELEAELFVSGKDKDGMENVRKLVSLINTKCKALCWPNDKYNKLKLVGTSYSLKNLGAIISYEVFGMLEDFYGHAFNMEHTDLGRKFAWVKVLPIYDKDRLKDGYNKHLVLMDKDGYVLDLDEDAETGFDDSRKTFRERWFYKWIDGYQELGLGYNILCFKEKPVTILPTKNILTDYAEITQKDSTAMTKKQAEEWNKLSLSFEKVKEWIDIGLECDDHNFVKWMIETKSQEDTKYNSYDDPTWLLNNLDSNGHESLADLKTEFSKI